MVEWVKPNPNTAWKTCDDEALRKENEELRARIAFLNARITELESIITVHRLVKTRVAALESALKQSNDTLRELTAIIPGNDKGALDAVANAMRANRSAYLGEMK
jgi:cell division septum initiation protein DivIVA